MADSSGSEEREIYSLSELCQAFDVKRIGTSGAIFDIEKLKWMNGVYLRNMDDKAYFELVEPMIKETVDPKYNYEDIAKALKDRVMLLTEVKDMIDFFNEVKDYSNDLYTNKKAKTNAEVAKKSLELALPALEALETFDNDGIFQTLAKVAADNELKNITIMYPIQVALSGKDKTPGGATMIGQILGKEETIKRIKDAIAKLA